MHFSVLVVYKQSDGDAIFDFDYVSFVHLSVIVVGVSPAVVLCCFCFVFASVLQSPLRQRSHCTSTTLERLFGLEEQ